MAKRSHLIPYRAYTTPAITTPSPLPGATQGAAYSTTIAESGGNPPITWSATGLAGSGLAIDAASGVISGTPSVVTTLTPVVTATDLDGRTSTRTYSLTIAVSSAPTITTSSPLPAATAGLGYSKTMAATGGVPPYTWSIVSDTPNTGSWLSINSSTGQLTGTPSTAETEAIVIQVTGSNLSASTGNFSLTVNPPVSTAGVRVGAAGKLVLASDGVTPVFLIGVSVSGMEFGPQYQSNGWLGCVAPTSAQIAAFITAGVASVAAAGKPYVQVNHARLAINTACYMGYTGISPDNGTAAAAHYRPLGINDDNGRPLYCAALTGGGKGTTPGTEIAGDPSAYRNFVDTFINNWIGAGAILGYPVYVTLDNHWNSVPWSVTGQIMLPVSQMATLGTGDIAYFQAISAKYGSNKSVLFELFNEQYGTNINNSGAEVSYLGQGNGTGTFNASPAPFAFPTGTTSPGGTNGGYLMNFGTPVMGGGQTGQAISSQQALNTCRTALATNVCIVGCPIATGWLPAWSYNGGAQTVVDPYTVGGIRQMAASFHAYAPGSSLANMDAIVAAGVPFICTEAGSITSVGGNVNAVAGSTYVRYKSHYSGYTWFGVPSNYRNLTSIYPDDRQPFANAYTMSGVAKPWYTGNVPRGPGNAQNNGSDTTQIPNGSN